MKMAENMADDVKDDPILHSELEKAKRMLNMPAYREKISEELPQDLHEEMLNN